MADRGKQLCAIERPFLRNDLKLCYRGAILGGRPLFALLLSPSLPELLNMNTPRFAALLTTGLWLLSLGAMARAQTPEDAPPEPRPKQVRVAVCQTLCVDDDRQGNFARLEDALRQAVADRAQIAVFPETCLLGWVNPNAHQLAHPIPGTADEQDVSRLSQLARHYGLMLCVGVSEKSGDNLYDAVVLIDRDGTLLLKHRKVNVLRELMTPPYTAGTDVQTISTRFGDIGLLICADSFHEPSLRKMHQLSPDLVLIPYGWAAPADSWPQHGDSLRHTVSTAARVIGAPIVGVDAVGEITHGPWTGQSYGGQSVVCDGAGKTLLVAADRRAQVVTVAVPLCEKE